MIFLLGFFAAEVRLMDAIHKSFCQQYVSAQKMPPPSFLCVRMVSRRLLFLLELPTWLTHHILFSSTEREFFQGVRGLFSVNVWSASMVLTELLTYSHISRIQNNGGFHFYYPTPIWPQISEKRMENKLWKNKLDWGWCFNLDLMRFLAELVDHMEIQS